MRGHLTNLLQSDNKNRSASIQTVNPPREIGASGLRPGAAVSLTNLPLRKLDSTRAGRGVQAGTTVDDIGFIPPLDRKRGCARRV